jgi:hypothetical protein
VKRAFALFICLWSTAGAAATLSATQSSGDIGMRIEALVFPESLPRELESGLTNRLYMRVTVLDGETALQVGTVELAIRYDLWDQAFTVSRTVDNAPAETFTLASIREMNVFLQALHVPRLFSARMLPPNRPLTLRAELLLNPIGREKLRMIRKWVAENSAPLNADQGISTSNTVFNRIFEQYADGSDLAAVWRVDLVSPPFRLVQQADEGR